MITTTRSGSQKWQGAGRMLPSAARGAWSASLSVLPGPRAMRRSTDSALSRPAWRLRAGRVWSRWMKLGAGHARWWGRIRVRLAKQLAAPGRRCSGGAATGARAASSPAEMKLSRSRTSTTRPSAAANILFSLIENIELYCALYSFLRTKQD